MERKAAKELLHIQGWLDRVDEIVERGQGRLGGRELRCPRVPTTKGLRGQPTVF